MDVGLVGYRNHAARILALLVKSDAVDRVLVYHPDAAKLASLDPGRHARIATTTRLDDLRRSDAVFIASPDDTHVPYLRELVPTGAYVYCEKPPATSAADLKWLESQDQAARGRIAFGFNHRFSDLAIAAKQGASKEGAPLHISVVTTHGLAFRDGYENSWRSKGRSPMAGVFGTLAVHHVDLCLWLLGRPDAVSVRAATWSPRAKSPDSVHVTLGFPNGSTASLFASYAAPFIHRAQVVFTDGYLDLDGGTLERRGPRETVDASGRFAPPPAKQLCTYPTSREYYDAALRRSLDHFLSFAAQKRPLPSEDYAMSLDTNALMLRHATAPLVEESA